MTLQYRVCVFEVFRVLDHDYGIACGEFRRDKVRFIIAHSQADQTT